MALTSFGLLFLSLIAVVGLAKVISPSIESAVVALGAEDCHWRGHRDPGAVHLVIFAAFLFLALVP